MSGKRKINKVKRWIVNKLIPDADIRMALIMNRAGFDSIATVVSECTLDEKSHAFLHSADGEVKYDAKYGLTRQMAEELRKFVNYTESYNEDSKTWTLKAELKVVK